MISMVEDEDFDDPTLIKTPEVIDMQLVRFGKEAARAAECLTEEETAEYFTCFLRLIVEQLTGIESPGDPEFQLPKELN